MAGRLRGLTTRLPVLTIPNRTLVYVRSVGFDRQAKKGLTHLPEFPENSLLLDPFPRILEPFG